MTKVNFREPANTRTKFSNIKVGTFFKSCVTFADQRLWLKKDHVDHSNAIVVYGGKITELGLFFDSDTVNPVAELNMEVVRYGQN